MATTKQYNDLQDGGNIQTGDKLAVAREGASELLTVPAESLAQRAAEIVSTDQLQELVADIGLGKQVLSQSLVNKGVDTSATDTLAQMAAKIDPLDVVGAKEYLTAGIVRSVSPLSAPLPLYSCRIPGRDLFIAMTDDAYDNLTLAVYGYTGGEFGQISALKLNSSLSSTPNPTAMNWQFSRNGDFVALKYGTEIFVLQVSQSGELSQKGNSFTVSSSSLFMFLIDNLGEKVALAETSKLHIYDVQSGIGISKSFVGFPAFAGLGWCSEDNSGFVVMNDGGYNSSAVSYYKGNIDWETASATYAKTTINLGEARNFKTQGNSIFPVPTKDLFIKCDMFSVSQSPFGSPDGLFAVIDTKTDSVAASKKVFAQCWGSGDSVSNGSITADKCTFYGQFSGDEITLFSFPFGKITYNSQTKKIEGSGAYNDDILAFGLFEYRNTNNRVLYPECTILQNGRLIPTAFSNFSADVSGYSVQMSSHGSSVYDFENYLFSEDKKCLGSVYKRNGQAVVQTLAKWDDEAFSAGAYDIENSSAVVQLNGEGEQ